MRILFLGSPDFAVPSLSALIGYPEVDIVAVVTQPDRPAGRGRALQPPPVKELALLHAMRILQPEAVRTDEFRRCIEDLGAFDLGVCVAYGHILPRFMLETPRLGMINAHASLLPAWRGAAPIQYALLNGDAVTGVTIQQMAPKMDAGDILWRVEEAILADDDAVSLTPRLATLAARGVIETIQGLAAGSIVGQPQDHDAATFTAKITQETGRIDWRRPAQSIVGHVRGLTPWPCAWTMRDSVRIKILCADALSLPTRYAPGTVEAVGKDGIEVATSEGRLRVRWLQPENRPAMEASQFINGYRVFPGEVWSS